MQNISGTHMHREIFHSLKVVFFFANNYDFFFGVESENVAECDSTPNKKKGKTSKKGV